MAAKNLKRFLLVLGIALLLPGGAGAADSGAVERSLWEDGAAFFARVWDGLTGVWTGSGPIGDPNGLGEGTDGGDGGGSIDPNG